MPTLKASLARSAESYAKSALEAYVQEALHDFVVFGGIAVELAVKAKLADFNPAFLADNGRFFNWAKGLHQAADSVEKLPSNLKTVGATEAVDRLIALDSSHRAPLAAANELFTLRNGQAHMGVHDAAEVQASFVSFLRCIDSLLNIDPDQFWEPHQELVAAVLDETLQANERAVRERMAAAQIRYERMVDDLPEDQLSMIVTVAESQAQQQADQEDHIEAVVRPCPVCEHMALIEGDTEETDWDVDYDDGVVTSATPILAFFPTAMECRICGLILEDAEDFAVAGLGESWVNDDVELDTWFERTYEPDYDYEL